MDEEQKTKKTLEDFEKALAWKAKQIFDLDWNFEVAVDFYQSAGISRTLAVLDADSLKPNWDRILGDRWVATPFYVKEGPGHSDSDFSEIRLDVSEEICEAYYKSFGKRGAAKWREVAPLSELRVFDEEIWRSGLEKIWEAAESSKLCFFDFEFGIIGDRPFPSPEQLVLEWSIANG